MYSSKSKAPLGRAHAQIKGLPSFIDPLKHKFGVKTIKGMVIINMYLLYNIIHLSGDSAGFLISPPKRTDEVEAESKLGKELYKISHYDYDVGEMVSYNYYLITIDIILL